MLRYLLYIVFGFILFSSCRNSKDLIYLQGIDSIETNFSRSEKINEYKIQNADLLYVNISSQNEAINAMFNKNSSSQFNGQRFNQISLYFNAYLVNDSGYISLPVIGDIKVAGLDIKSIKSLINEKAKVFITDAYIWRFHCEIFLTNFVFLQRALLMAIFAICDPSSAILLALQIKKLIWAIMHGSIGSLPLKYLLTENDFLCK